MICPVCHNNDIYVFVKSPKDYEFFTRRSSMVQILECKQCKSLFQSPLPSESETKNFYPADYQNYQKSYLSKILLNLLNRISAILFTKKFSTNTKLIDFGCGDGSFILSLRNLGWSNAFGYDPNIRETSVFATNPEYFLKNEQDFQTETNCDIIRLHHVIEHLPDIDISIRELSKKLSPNGRIIFQTPNPNTLTKRLFGRFWGPLHYPYHTVLLTPEGIKRAVKKWGMKIDKIYPTLAYSTGWSMSIENIIKKIFHLKSRGRLRLYPYIAIACLPIAIFESLIFRRNAAIFNYEIIKH